jgi:hypothetical protein
MYLTDDGRRPLERFRVATIRSKIFGIGLSRTGTTTLTQALKILGFKTKHCPMDANDFDRLEAFTDTSVVVQFASLDQRYPGSKYIYTIRDRDAWLLSCRRFFAEPSPNPDFRLIRRALYGCDRFEEELFRAAYDRHDSNVRKYFENRMQDLLVIDICAPDTDRWQKICTFLRRPVPKIAFPWENQSI